MPDIVRPQIDFPTRYDAALEYYPKRGRKEGEECVPNGFSTKNSPSSVCIFSCMFVRTNSVIITTNIGCD